LADFHLAGMLHDIGKLVLAANDVTLLVEAEAAPDPLQAEQALFGATHQDVGGYLLELWGLPDSIVEAAAFHHTPSAAPPGHLGPLPAVHAASAIADARRTGADPAVDAHFLAGAGLLGSIDAWFAAAEVAFDEL
jgi:HD-like signal output (HDOD) protein